MWELMHTFLLQVFRRGISVKDTGKTGGRCFCVTWTKTFFPLASFPWYVLSQQGMG